MVNTEFCNFLLIEEYVTGEECSEASKELTLFHFSTCVGGDAGV